MVSNTGWKIRIVRRPWSGGTAMWYWFQTPFLFMLVWMADEGDVCLFRDVGFHFTVVTVTRVAFWIVHHCWLRFRVASSAPSYSTDVSKITLDLYQCNWEQKLAQSQEQSLLFSGPGQAVQDTIAGPNPQEQQWTQSTLLLFRHVVPSSCFPVQWSKIWCWNSWGHLVSC